VQLCILQEDKLPTSVRQFGESTDKIIYKEQARRKIHYRQVQIDLSVFAISLVGRVIR